MQKDVVIYKQTEIDALLKCGDWYTGQGNEETKSGVNQYVGAVNRKRLKRQ